MGSVVWYFDETPMEDFRRVIEVDFFARVMLSRCPDIFQQQAVCTDQYGLDVLVALRPFVSSYVAASTPCEGLGMASARS
jgi:hypothetical protein